MIDIIKHGNDHIEKRDTNPQIHYQPACLQYALIERQVIKRIQRRHILLQIRIDHITDQPYLEKGFHQFHQRIDGKETFKSIDRIQFAEFRLQWLRSRLPFHLQHIRHKSHQKSNKQKRRHDQENPQHGTHKKCTESLLLNITVIQLYVLRYLGIDIIHIPYKKGCHRFNPKIKQYKESKQFKRTGHLFTLGNLPLFPGILQLFGGRFFCFLPTRSILGEELEIIL